MLMVVFSFRADPQSRRNPIKRPDQKTLYQTTAHKGSEIPIASPCTKDRIEEDLFCQETFHFRINDKTRIAVGGFQWWSTKARGEEDWVLEGEETIRP